VQARRLIPVTNFIRSCVAGKPAADASSKYPEPGIGFRVICFLRVPHKGTPTFYGLKPVKGRMPHKGAPIFHGLKPAKVRMPHKAMAVARVPACP
jgi:hypothetical protein